MQSNNQVVHNNEHKRRKRRVTLSTEDFIDEISNVYRNKRHKSYPFANMNDEYDKQYICIKEYDVCKDIKHKREIIIKNVKKVHPVNDNALVHHVGRMDSDDSSEKDSTDDSVNISIGNDSVKNNYKEKNCFICMYSIIRMLSITFVRILTYFTFTTHPVIQVPHHHKKKPASKERRVSINQLSEISSLPPSPMSSNGSSSPKVGMCINNKPSFTISSA